MPAFGSEAWCEQAIAWLNEDPDAAAAAEGWSGDFGVVIDRAAGPLGVHVGAPRAGRLPAPRFLSPEALEAAAPRYFARADEATWRALIDGSLDPIAAIVQRRLEVRGSLEPVVARLQYKGLAARWRARLAEEG